MDLGKSTLGRLISGLMKPTKGHVIIDNLITSKKDNFFDIRNKIGVVFQNPENQLVFNNIKDELTFCLNNLKKDNIKQRIEQSLNLVGMLDYINKSTYELSLGQKQKIAIASALSIKPKYIVFDEPTTMLDSKGKQDVYNIIKQLKNEGYTIIYITNMADEILLSDRIIIIDNGKIAKQINRKEILKSINILKQYEVKIPTIIDLILELKQQGIDINVEEFEAKQIAQKLLEVIMRKKNS